MIMCEEARPGENRRLGRWLLLVGLVIGVLADRLLVAPFGADLPYFAAIFWLCLLGLFCVVNRDRLRDGRAWYLAGCCGLLSVWNLIFDYNGRYGELTVFVLPCVLMALAVCLGGVNPKRAGEVALRWLLGWFVWPFSGIPACFQAVGSLTAGGKGGNLRRVLIGAALAVPLLAVVMPLLTGADQVFAYYALEAWSLNSLSDIVVHVVVVFVIGLLFFSFFWNARFMRYRELGEPTAQRMDGVIIGTVLSIAVFVYTLFGVVQFTYLFARAGLPHGLTYAQYARQGFGQLIAVVAINLALFGVTLRYTQRTPALTGLLTALLALSGLMLASGAVRLWLYIQTYGITWLRLLSAWFIIYLAAVLALTAVRLVKERLPLMAVCALALVGWYVALGFANPDALIVRWGLTHAESRTEWRIQNTEYLSDLSDDGRLALARLEGPDTVRPFYRGGGRSLSSHALYALLKP